MRSLLRFRLKHLAIVVVLVAFPFAHRYNTQQQEYAAAKTLESHGAWLQKREHTRSVMSAALRCFGIKRSFWRVTAIEFEGDSAAECDLTLLSKLPNLRQVSFKKTPITGIESLNSLHQISGISLESNEFLTARAISRLNLPSLESLDLIDQPLDHEAATAIGTNHPNLDHRAIVRNVVIANLGPHFPAHKKYARLDRFSPTDALQIVPFISRRDWQRGASDLKKFPGSISFWNPMGDGMLDVYGLEVVTVAESGDLVRSDENATKTTNSVAIVPLKGTFVSAIESHKPIKALSIRVKDLEPDTSEHSGSKKIEFTQDTQSIFVSRDSLPVNVQLSQEQP